MDFIQGDSNVAQFDPSHFEALPLVGIHSSIQMSRPHCERPVEISRRRRSREMTHFVHLSNSLPIVWTMEGWHVEQAPLLSVLLSIPSRIPLINSIGEDLNREGSSHCFQLGHLLLEWEQWETSLFHCILYSSIGRDWRREGTPLEGASLSLTPSIRSEGVNRKRDAPCLNETKYGREGERFR